MKEVEVEASTVQWAGPWHLGDDFEATHSQIPRPTSRPSVLERTAKTERPPPKDDPAHPAKVHVQYGFHLNFMGVVLLLIARVYIIQRGTTR